MTWHEWGNAELSGGALDLPKSFLQSQKGILCKTKASLVPATTFVIIISEIIFGWYLLYIKYMY